MVQAHEYFPVEDVGRDAPPGSPDETAFWISGDAASTPSGAWAAYTPPFVASIPDGANWNIKPLATRALYYDKEKKTFWIHPDGGYLEAAASTFSTTVVHVTDSSYALTDGVRTVVVTNTTANSYEITLPDIDGLLAAREVDVILDENSGGGAVSVVPDSGEEISGSAGIFFDSATDSLLVVSDGTPTPNNWQPRYFSQHLYDLAYCIGGTALVDLGTTQSITASLIVTSNGSVETDVVDEDVPGAGVTVDGLLIKDGRIGLYDELIFQARKTSDQILTNSWAPILTWSAADFEDSIFSWDSALGELTVNATTAIEIGMHVSFEQTAGTNRSTPEARIARKTAFTFNALLGTQQADYTRNSTNPYAWVAAGVFDSVTSGYKYRVEIEYQSLGSGATVVADRTNLRFWARRVNRA